MQNDDAKASARATLDELTESYTEFFRHCILKKLWTLLSDSIALKTDEEYHALHSMLKGSWR